MAFITRAIGDVVAEFIMIRAAFSGSLLVVEGESDWKFWSPRIDKSQCHLVIAGSKPTVEGAVLRANGMPLAGILGIVDDDYDSVCGVGVVSQNILRTDSRDAEAMLLKSIALERVIAELSDAAKVAAFEAAEGTSVRDALVKRSLLFGKLRWLDKRRGWGFDFENLSPYRFGNVNDWTIDEPAVLAMVANAVGVTISALTEALAELVVADSYSVLHGKDTLAVLAMGLRGKLGGKPHPVDRLCQMLRLAYDDGIASATNLFVAVRNWEASNAPFRVLKF